MRQRQDGRKSRLRLGLLLAFGLGLGFGCDGSQSCAGSGGAYEYPQSDLENGVEPVPVGAQARMTQAALDFLQVHLKDILLGALGAAEGDPDQIALVLEDPFEVIGGVVIGEGPNETYPTTILVDGSELTEKLSMAFVAEGEQVDVGGEMLTVPRDGILLDAVDVPVGLDARLFTEVNLGVTTATAGCDVDGTNPDYCEDGEECGILTGLTLGAMVYPEVQTGAGCDIPGAECIRVEVDVVRVALGSVGASSLDISVPPRCNVTDPPDDCSPECSDTVAVVDQSGDAECDIICAVEEFGVDLVTGLAGFIEPLIEDFLDDLLESAVQDALADIDGAPAEVAGRIDPAALAPGIAPVAGHDLGYAITPTTEAFDVNCPGPGCPDTKGMDFTLRSGLEAAPPDPGSGENTPLPHPCIDPILGQDFVDFYGDDEFRGGQAVALTGELEGEPYHLGASVAKDAVNQALFGAYNAGTLCLEISSDSVHVLSGGAFPLSAGTVDLLTEGRLRQLAKPSAPAIITLTPTEPPLVELGAGTEEDGHVRLSWSQVEVSFYTLTFERFARVFAVAADVSMEISVLSDPETQQLQVAIVDGPNVGNFDERYNEMLPQVSFSEVLESLVGLAFDALLADGLSFNFDLATALSDALGAPIYIDFMGLHTMPDDVDPTDRENLNLYLKLTDTPPPEMRTALTPQLRVADDAGLLTFQEHPTLPSVRVPRATGEVRLEGEGLGLNPGWEVFAVTDFGLAKGPFPVEDDGTVLIADPKLTLIGEHTLWVRARPAGALGHLGPEREVRVMIDPYRPSVQLRVAGGALQVAASDIGSDVGALLYSWRIDDGSWSPFTALSSRPVASLEGARRVEVRAMDRAGNVSLSDAVDLSRLAAR